MAISESKTGSFKLVGIVPLHDCHSQFLSNLKAGKVYQFYKAYTIAATPQTFSEKSFDHEVAAKLIFVIIRK